MKNVLIVVLSSEPLMHKEPVFWQRSELTWGMSAQFEHALTLFCRERVIGSEKSWICSCLNQGTHRGDPFLWCWLEHCTGLGFCIRQEDSNFEPGSGHTWQCGHQWDLPLLLRSRNRNLPAVQLSNGAWQWIVSEPGLEGDKGKRGRARTDRRG